MNKSAEVRASAPLRHASSSCGHVGQGEVVVTVRPDCQVGMILGSCVAAVLWDADTQVGGVNHLLLPPVQTPAQLAMGVQVNLMERLINGVLSAGGRHGHLQAKVFGGAGMIRGLSDAGRRNAHFVTQFLADEGITCTAQSLGGHKARRLRIWPATGRVLQRTLRDQISDEMESETAAVDFGNTAGVLQGPDADAFRLSGVELL
ncbi:chemotaxis protein CheD [Shimia ponticola]|uniref:chemotaxis protein CheD n=1 Tax=Shimia ponticola TaxID=2582893 RepID=UPI00164C930F|nr:chemotaxis protein CheD [Shimia ponticola]